MRTFETLPRVEPGLGTGSAGGRGRGVGSAPGKASTLATLPKSRAAGSSCQSRGVVNNNKKTTIITFHIKL